MAATWQVDTLGGPRALERLGSVRRMVRVCKAEKCERT